MNQSPLPNVLDITCVTVAHHVPPVDVVAVVHAAIDAQTEAFSRRTGITCPSGCGACCHSPHVETTVADLMPLAEELVQHGNEATILQRLNESSDARCVLFDGDADDMMKGRCSMYAWRPSICRLFGFAGRRDADGRPQFTACRIHTQHMPDVVALAHEGIASGTISLPILSDLAGQVSVVMPGASAAPKPINEALREAINRAGLRSMLTSNDGSDDDGDTPQCPPREAA